MMLGEPDGVIARLVHDGKSLECRFVNRSERHGPVAPAEELQNSDFHCSLTDPRNRCGTSCLLRGSGNKLSVDTGRRCETTAYPHAGGSPWTSKGRLHW